MIPFKKRVSKTETMGIQILIFIEFHLFSLFGSVEAEMVFDYVATNYLVCYH